MKYFFSIIISYGLAFSFCFSQSKINSFDAKLDEDFSYSLRSIKLFSKSNNAYNFMALGYFLNSNNIMYLKTKNKKYLDLNLEIIEPLITRGTKQFYESNAWVVNVSRNNQNFKKNGQEHLISEGYFFRYLGEFLSIITQAELYENYQKPILKVLASSFDKWKSRSFKRYNDYSMMFHLRMHTGANWAVVALYLKEFSRNTRGYDLFLSQFDNQLKKGLKLLESNGVSYYFWNSTYPDKFTSMLKEVDNYDAIPQDVSHGNHVVLYLIKAAELGNRNWKDFNFEYLVNTLKTQILSHNRIADYVNGEFSAKENSGWKLSDGWLKLINYDVNLAPIVLKKASQYDDLIEKSSLALQFKSVLYHDSTY